MENNSYKETKEKAVSGLLWSFLERFGAQGVTFVVSIVLARLLDPEVYGTVAIVTVVMEILNVFIDSGLGNALIQKKDADDLDFSSVFYFNLLICLGSYAIVCAAAPLVAGYFDIPILTPLIRVMGLTLVISGVKNIQRAYVARQMCFKRFFFATLGGTISAAALGIWMALRGYGVWALVAQALLNNLIDTIILWITVKWRPKRMFSFARFRGLFSFGWKLLLSSLINTVYNNLRQLVIGKMYTTSSLAFYNRGYMLPNVIVSNINSAVDTVLLPAMSSAQEDIAVVRQMTRRSVQLSAFVMWPAMMGLAACAQPLVLLLLTDKWLPCVPFVVMFCVSYAFMPSQTASLNAIKAVGCSDVYLRLEIIKKIVSFAILFATMWFGPLVMAASNILCAVICQLIGAPSVKKLLGYTYRQQLEDIMPPMLLSAVMFAVVYAVSFTGMADWLMLLVQIPLGVVLYCGGAKLLKMESLDYTVLMLKKLLGRGGDPD